MWWWSAVAIAGGTCDKAAIEVLSKAIPTVEADQRAALAAAGLAEACPGTPLGDTARQLNAADPAHQQVVDLQLATAEIVAFTATCPGGPGALASAVQAADAHRALWKPCALADTGWFLEDEWSAAEGPIVVPLVAAHHLAQSGVPPIQLRGVVRALAGVTQTGRAPRFADGLAPDTEVEVPGAAAEGLAGFAPDGRVKPEWSKDAREAGGSCTVSIGVTPEGGLRKLTWTDCPEVLRKDVEKAIGKSTLAPASANGAPAPGRFEATYKVK